MKDFVNIYFDFFKNIVLFSGKIRKLSPYFYQKTPWFFLLFLYNTHIIRKYTLWQPTQIFKK